MRSILNFFVWTDAEAEAPILWPSDAKSRLTGKDPDAGKDWRWEEKGVTENELVGWHHWLNGHEPKQTLGDSEGQGSLVCCSPMGHKESDISQQLNQNSRGDPGQMKVDVSSETTEGEENRTASLKCWKESQPTIIYSVKLPIKSEDEKKTLSDQ